MSAAQEKRQRKRRRRKGDGRQKPLEQGPRQIGLGESRLGSREMKPAAADHHRHQGWNKGCRPGLLLGIVLLILTRDSRALSKVTLSRASRAMIDSRNQPGMTTRNGVTFGVGNRDHFRSTCRRETGDRTTTIARTLGGGRTIARTTGAGQTNETVTMMRLVRSTSKCLPGIHHVISAKDGIGSQSTTRHRNRGRLRRPRRQMRCGRSFKTG